MKVLEPCLVSWAAEKSGRSGTLLLQPQGTVFEAFWNFWKLFSPCDKGPMHGNKAESKHSLRPFNAIPPWLTGWVPYLFFFFFLLFYRKFKHHYSACFTGSFRPEMIPVCIRILGRFTLGLFQKIMMRLSSCLSGCTWSYPYIMGKQTSSLHTNRSKQQHSPLLLSHEPRSKFTVEAGRPYLLCTNKESG